MVQRKRLGQKIDRALLHRLHGDFDGAERRHHDHRRQHVLRAQLFQERQAVHAGQFQIGQNQVDVARRASDPLRPCPRPSPRSRRRTRCRPITRRYFSSSSITRITDIGHNFYLSAHGRQVNAKHAAFAGRAFHRDLAAVLVDDFGDDGQAQTHALRLGSEERIEDALQILGIDAGAAVDHGDLEPSVAMVRCWSRPSASSPSPPSPAALACAAFMIRLSKARSSSSASKATGGMSGE